jgi:hypothetical protein
MKHQALTPHNFHNKKIAKSTTVTTLNYHISLISFAMSKS